MSSAISNVEAGAAAEDSCVSCIEEVMDSILSGPESPSDIPNDISEENPYYEDHSELFCETDQVAASYEAVEASKNFPKLSSSSGEAAKSPVTSTNDVAVKIPLVESKEKPNEPEVVIQWRKDRAKMLEDRDAVENDKKKELLEAGRFQYETWEQNYKELLEKTRKENRNSNDSFIGGNSIEKHKIGFTNPTVSMQKSSKKKEDEKELSVWEYVGKLCDLSSNNRSIKSDVSRMRSLMLQLKREKFSSPKLPVQS